MIEKLFQLRASGTTVKREIVAGCTTFMTLYVYNLRTTDGAVGGGNGFRRSDGGDVCYQRVRDGIDGIARQLSDRTCAGDGA